MSLDAVTTTLKALRLHGMAQAVEELAQQGTPLYREAMPLITTLLKAEVAEREVRLSAEGGALPDLSGSEQLRFCPGRGR